MDRISVAQFSPADLGGGAERSALSLHRMLRELDCDSRLFVGEKRSGAEAVYQIPNDAFRNPVYRIIREGRKRFDAQPLRPRGVGRFLRAAERIAEPVRTVREHIGHEDIYHPGFWNFNRWSRISPSIFHFHNLHGGYFDFRALPVVCGDTPVVLNVRDGWLLSGHCAHGLECTRWQVGCGQCPDLGRYPAIRRDRTSKNLALKRDIFSNLRAHVVTPSQWMLDQCLNSQLRDSIASATVIPNGFDDSVFTLGSRPEARQGLGLAPEDFVVSIAASNLESNPWKDTANAVEGLVQAANQTKRQLVLLQVGAMRESVSETGKLRIVSVPFVQNDTKLAQYYRAADIILHCARVESFGNVLLEARACGAMAIATRVGGIPEQISSPQLACNRSIKFELGPGEPDGVLLPPGDSAAVASAIVQMELECELFQRIAQAGLDRVRTDFTWRKQAARFLRYYQSLLSA